MPVCRKTSLKLLQSQLFLIFYLIYISLELRIISYDVISLEIKGITYDHDNDRTASSSINFFIRKFGSLKFECLNRILLIEEEEDYVKISDGVTDLKCHDHHNNNNKFINYHIEEYQDKNEIKIFKDENYLHS